MKRKALSMMSRKLRILVPLGLVVSACEPPPAPPPPPAKVPVTSEVLVAGPFQPSVTVLGRIEPAVRIDLRAQSSGRLRYPARFADGLRTGEPVTRGELLFEIDDPTTQLHLAETELMARAAEAELERAAQGVAGGFRSEVELEAREIDAELARRRLDDARRQVQRLRHSAPVSGVLEVDDKIPPGSEIAAERLLARLAGDGRRQIEGWAAAADGGALRPGLSVELLVPRDRLVGRGTLSEVSRRIDDDGTLRLIATVDEDLALPAVGEGVEMRVLLEAKSAAVTVPAEALIVDSGVARVFVLEPRGSDYTARLRILQTGGRDRGRIEVIAGVRDGERLAVRGAEFLADGLTAAEAESGEDR